MKRKRGTFAPPRPDVKQNEQGEWLCPVCGREFSSERGVRAHLGREHGIRGTTNSTNIGLHDGDFELVLFIQDFLGASKSEAIRSAIRAYAMSLQQLGAKIDAKGRE